jgi:bifunctional DNA-binding transcriptional regulator/antitoxin component of YhaV-PrlF toxin-antitoxin module
VSAISSKNQVTIPVDVLRAAGLTAGDDVRITSPGAVNLSEILIGPLRQGTSGRMVQMLADLGIDTVAVGDTLAHAAASVRARTNLKLPDAYAVAVALEAAQRDSVRLATFDPDVILAHQAMSGA